MIEITKRASEALLAAIARTNGQAAGVRITVQQDKCSGPTYSMGFVTGAFEDDREISTPSGITVFTGDDSLSRLIGCVLDYGETETGQAFSFFNPNALAMPSDAPSHGCSCGKNSCSST